MKKQTAVQWLHYHLLHLMQTKEWRSKDLHIEKFDELFAEALAMEREQIEENMAKAITFGWDLSQYHRHNTEEKLLQMQKDFITSVIEGGEQ